MQNAQRFYPYVRAELMSLLPDSDCAAVGKLGEQLVVLAVFEDSLYTVAAKEEPNRVQGAHDVVVIHARRIPLSRVATWVSLEGRLEASGPNPVRLRHWEFTLQDASELIALDTAEPTGQMFGRDNAPDETEVLARELARKVGWGIPEVDDGIRHY
ncbi:MAG: hypothetical protein ACLQMH_07835 [Solirubrobacteraceae bacterium]